MNHNCLYLYAIQFSIFLTLSCSSHLGNKIDEMALMCGDGYDSSKQYIQVLGEDGQSQENLQFLSNDGKATLRGCVERPDAGDLLVLNSERNASVWVSVSSSEKIRLKRFDSVQIPQSCHSTVHASGNEFVIDFGSISNAVEKKLLRVSTSLVDGRGIAVVKWDGQAFNDKMLFKFPDNSVIKQGEYRISNQIFDNLSHAIATSECALRIDESDLILSPSESIKFPLQVQGQEVLVVKPDYSVNFYVHEGFRDIRVEYCLDEIDSDEFLRLGEQSSKPCNNPVDFLKTSAEHLHKGLWRLKYRASRGSVDNGWKTNFFVVEKSCVGDFEDIAKIGKEICTSLEGNLHISKMDEDNAHYLDLIQEIKGEVSLSDSILTRVRAFPNLKVLQGDLTIRDNQGESFEGFENLSFMKGHLTFQGNEELRRIVGFDSVEMISGDLGFFGSSSLKEFKAFGKLRIVENILALQNIAIDDLSFLKNLEYIGSLNLFGLPNFRTYDGLQKLKFLGSLYLANLPTYDLDELPKMKKIKDFSISDENLTGIMTFPSSNIENLIVHDSSKIRIRKSSDEKVKITKSMSLSGIEAVDDLDQFDFTSNISYLTFFDLEINNIDAFKVMEKVSFLKFENITGDVDFSAFSKVNSINELVLVGIDSVAVKALPMVKELPNGLKISNNKNLKNISIGDGKLMLGDLKWEGNPLANATELLKGVEFMIGRNVIEDSRCLSDEGLAFADGALTKAFPEDSHYINYSRELTLMLPDNCKKLKNN